jgi:hypothetical protein
MASYDPETHAKEAGTFGKRIASPWVTGRRLKRRRSPTLCRRPRKPNLTPDSQLARQSRRSRDSPPSGPSFVCWRLVAVAEPKVAAEHVGPPRGNRDGVPEAGQRQARRLLRDLPAEVLVGHKGSHRLLRPPFRPSGHAPILRHRLEGLEELRRDQWRSPFGGRDGRIDEDAAPHPRRFPLGDHRQQQSGRAVAHQSHLTLDLERFDDPVDEIRPRPISLVVRRPRVRDDHPVTARSQCIPDTSHVRGPTTGLWTSTNVIMSPAAAPSTAHPPLWREASPSSLATDPPLDCNR